MGGYARTSGSGYSNGYVSGGSIVIDPAVQAFADNKSITNQQEINALNALYVGLNDVITNHGSGSILYLNGFSPTSLAAAREAIIYGAGNQTATVGGTAPTHSSNGIQFNGTNNYWNVGGIQNNKAWDELLLGFSRTNTITVTGVSMGVNHSGACQIFPRTSGSNSGYSLSANYTAFSFGGSGNYIGYNNGTTMGIWVNGVFQTPTSTVAPITTLSGTNDFYLGARNNSGVASNFVDERIGAVALLWDGGTLFNQTEIETVDELLFNYNANVV